MKTTARPVRRQLLSTLAAAAGGAVWAVLFMLLIGHVVHSFNEWFVCLTGAALAALCAASFAWDSAS